MGTTEIPEKFFGRFKLERSENFDEFLASKGLNWFLRKIMGMAAITKIIEKSAEKPGTYNFTNLSTKINLEYKSFSLGEEFEDLGFDGKKHKITFDMADENTLSEHHIRLESNDRETYFYNIDGNYLVLTMKNEPIVCKRYLKRI